MDQSLLELDPASAPARSAADDAGFQLGWDHAHHGLVPPPELLLDGTPLRQGWQAGRSVFGQRTMAALQPVRRWLALRTDAWRQGVSVETTQLTAHYIAQIEVSHCPVTLKPLGGVSAAADAPVIERLRHDAGYAAGHVVMMSRQAATARAGCTSAQALATATSMEARGEVEHAGLDAAAWRRLAALISFVTPMPHAQAAAMPMCVLPPNRVRVLNPAQGLQALVSWQLAAPGWSRRLRQLGEMAEEITGESALRQDFQLFIGAIAPRALELPAIDSCASHSLAQRLALAQLWSDARVMRRWQHWLLSLGEAATEALLNRAAAAGLAGVRTLLHEKSAATEGWVSALPGLLKPTRRRVRVVGPGRRSVAGDGAPLQPPLQPPGQR